MLNLILKLFMKKLFLMFFCLMAIGVSAQDVPNIFTYKVGAVEVVLLSEGQATGDSKIFIGATPEMIQKAMPNGTYPRSCNAFLVRIQGKNILVDTGTGRNLLENLNLLGITPEQIDAILITHVHGDHIGGMLKDGKVVFPNAEFWLSKAEHEWSLNGGERTVGARNVIEVYNSRLCLFEPKEIDANPELLFPGIRAIAAYGHTPGHTLFMVESGDEKLIIWGDLTHAMAIQMPFPQVAMTFDVDSEKAISARKKVLEYVVGKNITIAGIHNSFPGMGKLTKAPEGGYIYTEVKISD